MQCLSKHAVCSGASIKQTPLGNSRYREAVVHVMLYIECTQMGLKSSVFRPKTPANTRETFVSKCILLKDPSNT